MTLLTGDSGIGKTTVLEAAATARNGWVNSTPRSLPAGAGALRQTVLNALADVVEQTAAERGQVTEIADRLAGAGKRMRDEGIRELGHVVAAELLSIIRGRLGPDFGEAISLYLRKLQEEYDESLSSRLADANEESVVPVLAELVGEVTEFAAGKHLGLSFDRGERLNDDETRLLADLAGHLPDGCHLRVAFATDSAASADRARQVTVLEPSTYEMEVGPLAEDAVAAWITDSGLPDVDPRDAIRRTGGNPLHLGDLIRHLQVGGDLEDVTLNEQVARRVEASWQALPVEVAAVARKLCVLPDPLPHARLLELVGLDASAFGETVERLEQARIFPSRVEGVAWFHEQRRAFVLSKLSHAELDEAATAAADAVWEELLATDDGRWVTTFTSLATDAVTLQNREPEIRHVLGLAEPELATAAALVELITPENKGAAAGDVLFSHARRFTTQELDPASVIANLETAGLVVTASNDHATIVVPTFSARTVAVVEGCGYRRLRRPPVVGLSSATFELGVRGRLGAFATAAYGIGRPSTGALGRVAFGGEAAAGYGRRRPNRRDDRSHLLARANYAGRPMWLVASYDDANARDGALSAIDGFSADVLGEQLVVRDALAHPLQVVARQRFANAGARAFRSGSLHTQRDGQLRFELAAPLSYELGLQRRVETAQLLRGRSSDLERYATELDEPFGIYWDAGDDWFVECLVTGADERAVRVEGLAGDAGDRRFASFRIAQRLGLDDSARLDSTSMSFGRTRGAHGDDPVMAEIGRRRTKAALFNSGQPRRTVELEQSTLEEIVGEGFLRQMADARALQSIAAQPVEPLPPLAVYAYVLLETPTAGWVAGAGADVLVIERESESSDDEAHVASSQGGVDLTAVFPRATGSTEDLFASAFGFAPNWSDPRVLNASRGGIDSLLTDYGGWDRDDVDLRWPA